MRDALDFWFGVCLYCYSWFDYWWVCYLAILDFGCVMLWVLVFGFRVVVDCGGVCCGLIFGLLAGLDCLWVCGIVDFGILFSGLGALVGCLLVFGLWLGLFGFCLGVVRILFLVGLLVFVVGCSFLISCAWLVSCYYLRWFVAA